MNGSLQSLIAAVQQNAQEKPPVQGDVITVSETVSTAASVYETVRNSLEYDEEHRLRRNAIHRILKRRTFDGDVQELAAHLLRELVWAKYLPNKQVPESSIQDVEMVLAKYHGMFGDLHEETKEDAHLYEWLLDVCATEVEYVLDAPIVDESLASYAYQELGKRIEWSSVLIDEKDRDLQLYIAIHRTVLKSDLATLRYRVFSLYYPAWVSAEADAPVVQEIRQHLRVVMDSVEKQLSHPGADAMYRFVRKHAIVFHVIRDIIADNTSAFTQALDAGDVATLDTAITKATEARYDGFSARLKRSVFRAVIFLFFSKLFLALVIELPYEVFVLQITHYTPLIVNVVFPPILLTMIGMTVRLPKKKNTEKVIEEVHALFGLGDDFGLTFKVRQPWKNGGVLSWIFRGLYVGVLLFSVALISAVLISFEFNGLSIAFFLFFLSLVAFFGIRVRNTKRELIVIDSHRGVIGTLIDIFTLPIIRVGRWLSLQATRINIFLFFFDFIVEAPFKAAAAIIESWLAFLREKKEEI